MPRCFKGSLSEPNSDQRSCELPVPHSFCKRREKFGKKPANGAERLRPLPASHRLSGGSGVPWKGPRSGELRTRYKEEILQHLQTTSISLYLEPLQASCVCQRQRNLLASRSNWQGQEGTEANACPKEYPAWDEGRAFAPPRAYATTEKKAGGGLERFILLSPLLGSDRDVLIPTGTVTCTTVVLQG